MSLSAYKLAVTLDNLEATSANLQGSDTTSNLSSVMRSIAATTLEFARAEIKPREVAAAASTRAFNSALGSVLCYEFFP